MAKSRLEWLRVVAAAGALLGIRALVRNRLRLDGAVVLITGGSRGLGRLIARELARRGSKLVLCARSVEELADAERELSRHTEVLVERCDVSSREAVEQLVQRALARFGRIDALINNASIIQVGPFDAMNREDFERAMAINFWGTFYPTMAVLPSMRARRRGRIVNVTSIGGRLAVPHLLPYSCAKFAVTGFSEGLRAEVRRDGVRVTTVIPGLMRTGSPENALFKGQREREYAWFALGDALPLTSVAGERAARRIVRALRDGEIEVVISWQARIAQLFHDLFPATTVSLLSIAQRLLPSAPAGGGEARRGRDLHRRSSLVRKLLAGTAEQTGQYTEERY